MFAAPERSSSEKKKSKIARRASQSEDAAIVTAPTFSRLLTNSGVNTKVSRHSRNLDLKGLYKKNVALFCCFSLSTRAANEGVTCQRLSRLIDERKPQETKEEGKKKGAKTPYTREISLSPLHISFLTLIHQDSPSSI